MENIYDYARAAALVGGFGYIATQRKWLVGDSLLWSIYSACIFLCPQTMFPEMTSGLMSYLLRIFASVVVAMETMWYLSSRTRDMNVIGAILWTRILGSIAVIVMACYSYTIQPDNISTRMVLFDFVAVVMLLLTSVYQLAMGQYQIGGREKSGNISKVMHLNFIFLFVAGLLNMAFPSWVMPFMELGKMEIMVVRVIGALFFGLSFTAWFASSFRYDNDRVAFLVSEMLACALMFMSLNIAHFKDNLFTPKQVLIMHLGTVPSLVVLLGLYLLWKDEPAVHYSESTYFTRSKSQ